MYRTKCRNSYIVFCKQFDRNAHFSPSEFSSAGIKIGVWTGPYWWKTCPTVEVTWSFTYFSLCKDAPSPHKKGRGRLYTDRLHILGLKPRSRHFKSSMLLFKENHSNHFSKPWFQKLEWFTVVLLLYFGNIISISVGETSQFKVKPVIILKS